MLIVGFFSRMGSFSDVNEFMAKIQVFELVALHNPTQPHQKRLPW
jgi:hypothetical protein